MEESKKQELERLKDYCYKYIEREYGKRQNYIRKTRITKHGLFIYGHKAYSPMYSQKYDIYTFINWYDANNYKFIQDMLDYFVNDCNILKECE